MFKCNLGAEALAPKALETALRTALRRPEQEATHPAKHRAHDRRGRRPNMTEDESCEVERPQPTIR